MRNEFAGVDRYSKKKAEEIEIRKTLDNLKIEGQNEPLPS